VWHVLAVFGAFDPARMRDGSVIGKRVVFRARSENPGTQPRRFAQVLLIVAGSGWVAGNGAVKAGQAAYWVPGEVRTTGSGTGLTAIAFEGGLVTVLEPGVG
jgi:hypothetical protein